MGYFVKTKTLNPKPIITGTKPNNAENAINIAIKHSSATPTIIADNILAIVFILKQCRRYNHILRRTSRNQLPQGECRIRQLLYLG